MELTGRGWNLRAGDGVQLASIPCLWGGCMSSRSRHLGAKHDLLSPFQSCCATLTVHARAAYQALVPCIEPPFPNTLHTTVWYHA
jgi:hypothetical protein